MRESQTNRVCYEKLLFYERYVIIMWEIMTEVLIIYVFAYVRLTQHTYKYIHPI
jgi:hypothetical protein